MPYQYRSDGNQKWADECAGKGQGMCGAPNDKKPSVDLTVAWYVKEAKSFGQPFTTHAVLCQNHAEAFGYKLEKAMAG